jgi:hypothetical protein
MRRMVAVPISTVRMADVGAELDVEAGRKAAHLAALKMHRLNLGHIAVEDSLTCIGKKMKALYDETSRWSASIGENGLVPSTLRR